MLGVLKATIENKTTSVKLKFHWDQFPRNFLVTPLTSPRTSWRRRQQVRGEVNDATRKLATHLRCGGILSNIIITNFLLILTVK